MNRTNIVKRVKYWQEKMGLQNWEIDVNFDKNEKFDSSVSSDGWQSLAAFVRANDQYKFATIYFNPKKTDNLDDSSIIHEMLHIVTSPLTNFAHAIANTRENDDVTYFKEQITTDLERIISRLAK